MNRTTPDALSAKPGFGLRCFLYATAAVTGAAIMVVEILGAKMLSPFIGTSHFVWTAQIAVTLVALAAGYYAGGRMADRSGQVHRLYGAILGAAVYLMLTVTMCEPVAYACVSLDLALGSLLASAILFFIPLGLLAMTGPFLIRAITASLSDVGGSVGRLTAVSTLGSFAGTLLIGYILIPLLPNSVTMYATAVVLILLAGVYFAAFRRSRRAFLAILIVTATAAALAGPLRRSFHGEYRIVVERYRSNSHFGLLQVLDRRDAPVRYLLNDNLIQNAYDTERRQSTLAFSYVLTELAESYAGPVRDALLIGMGVGVVPMELAGRGARVDTVEINPAIVPLAIEFFNLAPARHRLTIGDGRQFMNRCTNRYDAVLLDAFLGDSCPSHLMTREAFTAARRLLRPHGALIVHSFGDLAPGRDYLLAALKRTLLDVFGSVAVHTTGEGAFFFVARDEPPAAAIRPFDPTSVHPLARREVATALDGPLALIRDDGVLLTDDRNPADYYDARNREILRRQLALSASRM